MGKGSRRQTGGEVGSGHAVGGSKVTSGGAICRCEAGRRVWTVGRQMGADGGVTKSGHVCRLHEADATDYLVTSSEFEAEASEGGRRAPSRKDGVGCKKGADLSE